MAAILDVMTSQTAGAMDYPQRHVFTPEEVARAHSAEALAKRRETLRENIEDRAHDIRELALWGMVPGAIADELGTSDRIVECELRRSGLWRRWYG